MTMKVVYLIWLRGVIINIIDLSAGKLRFSEHKNNKKYVLWNAGICPIASKVCHVTLATPPFGLIHHPLYTTSSNGSNRENTKSLASRQF